MIGLGILLAIVGAILYFALETDISGLDIDTVGVILMAGGGLAFLVGLFQRANRRRPSSIRTTRQQSPDGTTIIEETDTD